MTSRVTRVEQLPDSALGERARQAWQDLDTATNCGALAIDNSGVRTCVLPRLESSVERAARYALAYRALDPRGPYRELLVETRAPGMRDLDAPTNLPAATFDELRAAVQASFWEPVKALLPDLRALHIVTAPDLHGAPIEAANPGIVTHYYPGLPAFFGLFVRRERVDSQRSLAIDVASDTALASLHPIPFAATEAHFVGRVLTDAKAVSGRELLERLASGNGRTRIHLACHGLASGERERLHSVLVVDWETNARLDPSDVTAYAARSTMSSAPLASAGS